jgi:hypothetical protein
VNSDNLVTRSTADQSYLNAGLLNLHTVPMTYPKGALRTTEVLMTRHRTITGFVAVALIAVAATAATMRSHLHWTDVTGTTTSKGSTVDANVPAASFDERWSAMSASTTDSSER